MPQFTKVETKTYHFFDRKHQYDGVGIITKVKVEITSSHYVVEYRGWRDDIPCSGGSRLFWPDAVEELRFLLSLAEETGDEEFISLVSSKLET